MGPDASAQTPPAQTPPTKRPPMLQRVLKAYAGRLVGRLPKTPTGATTATATAQTTDWQVGARLGGTSSANTHSLVTDVQQAAIPMLLVCLAMADRRSCRQADEAAA